jgi:hypothetical protein
MTPTTHCRDARRYYAAQYWHYRLRGHASRTTGARITWLGRAEIYHNQWRYLWEKRRAM